MSDEDLAKYARLIDDTFEDRQSRLNRFCSLVDNFYEHKVFEHYAHFSIVGLTCFGVKDTLKPIDEYIEDIKASSEYKEFIESEGV